jgi:hypothetical protein
VLVLHVHPERDDDLQHARADILIRLDTDVAEDTDVDVLRVEKEHVGARAAGADVLGEQRDLLHRDAGPVDLLRRLDERGVAHAGHAVRQRIPIVDLRVAARQEHELARVAPVLLGQRLQHVAEDGLRQRRGRRVDGVRGSLLQDAVELSEERIRGRGVAGDDDLLGIARDGLRHQGHDRLTKLPALDAVLQHLVR